LNTSDPAVMKYILLDKYGARKYFLIFFFNCN